MPDYRRAYIKGGVFFFTVATYERRPLLSEESAVDALRDSFKRVMAAYPFDVDTIVILPDHLHSIWVLPDDDSDFSVRWRLIKTAFSRGKPAASRREISDSRLMKKEKGIWQRRFWEHMIRDEADLNSHRDYIHFNPIKHSLAISPGEWKHSSFHRFVKEGFYPPDWGQNPEKQLLEMNPE